MKEKQLKKGTELKDRYRVERVLGQGGFSITYLATDLRMDVPVTLKQFDMSKAVSGNEPMKEAKMAAGFYDLEGIAAARDFFEEEGTSYIVMEYVEGINITDYIRQNGSMDGRDVLGKMRPIMQSLSRIHAKGVIHRDISADNLILSTGGNLKLIDFGAARQQIRNADRPYTLIFKRGYAPLEQCRENGIQGPWTDVYAMCATMYFMMTGIVPDDAIDRLINDRLRPLWEIAGIGLDREEASAIMKGMAVEAKERYASVPELYAQLYGEELTDEAVSFSSGAKWNRAAGRKRRKQNTTYMIQEVRSFYRRKKWKRRLVFMVAVVVLSVVVTGIIFWGNVFRENVPAGQMVQKPNETAEIVPAPTASPVVSAAEPTEVPDEEPKITLKDYRGQSRKMLQEELDRYRNGGLKLRIVKKYSTKKKGIILEQKPPAGSIFDSWKGVTLTLTVSKGKKSEKSTPVPVPTAPVRQQMKRNDRDNVSFHGSLDGF